MNRAIAVVCVAWSSAALAQSTGAQAEMQFRQCREELSQLETACGLFLDATRQTRSAADAASQQLHNVAQAGTQELEPHVSKLTINVPRQSQLDGLEISRGTDRIGAVMWNRALPIDSGTYTITARASGAHPWSTQVTVAAENGTKTVEIPDLHNLPRDLNKPAAPPPPPVVVPALDPSPTPPHASGKIVPFVVGADALALLSRGLGLELWAESRYAAAKSEMTSQLRRDFLYNAANAKRHAAEAFAVSGLAAGGAAMWLYLRDRNRERDTTTNAGVHVVPTATGLALSGRF